jgi:hypothetical protein
VVQLLYLEKVFFGKLQRTAVCFWTKNMLESLQEAKRLLAQKQKQFYAAEIRQKKNDNCEKK